MLEYASGFMSEQCPEGIVAIAANTLRLIWIYGSIVLDVFCYNGNNHVGLHATVDGENGQ